MSGKKFDSGKPDLSLIPLSALIEEARGFMLGAEKYGRYNYTQGMEASRLVAAALRHIYAWNQGEEVDPESGASHLGHARCCLAMLLENQRLGSLSDNRFKEPDAKSCPEKVVSRDSISTSRLADGTEVTWDTGPAYSRGSPFRYDSK